MSRPANQRRRAVTSSELDAARMVLARMGIEPGDLLDYSTNDVAVPTFAEYAPVVAAAVTTGTRRTYGAY